MRTRTPSSSPIRAAPTADDLIGKQPELDELRRLMRLLDEEQSCLVELVN
jgi:hypothetical protein